MRPDGTRLLRTCSISRITVQFGGEINVSKKFLQRNLEVVYLFVRRIYDIRQDNY